MNGNPANINTPLEPNSEITIEPSTSGAAARYTIGQLEECRQATLTFNINGKDVVCPKFVQVNGSLEPASYEIQEGDEIETRNFYTVGQIAEFMDIVIDEDQEILVNNREADLNTLVYENFSIEWVENPYGVRSAQYSSNYSNLDEVTENSIDEEQLSATQDEMVQSEGAQDEIAQDETMQNETIQNEMARGEKTQDEASQVGVSQNEVQVEENDNSVIIVVTVNGEAVELSGKESYIFVDIFDRITFDLQAGRGRAIATLINGREAQFSEELHDGDKIELYWKEN